MCYFLHAFIATLSILNIQKKNVCYLMLEGLEKYQRRQLNGPSYLPRDLTLKVIAMFVLNNVVIMCNESCRYAASCSKYVHLICWGLQITYNSLNF